MEIPNEALLLRIFVGEDDRDDDRPLYEAIVLRAGELHLAGAAVLRGARGFGRSSRLHTTKILRPSGDLPLVIGIGDREDKIHAFRPDLDERMTKGLVEVEEVRGMQKAGKRRG